MELVHAIVQGLSLLLVSQAPLFHTIAHIKIPQLFTCKECIICTWQQLHAQTVWYCDHGNSSMLKLCDIVCMVTAA